MSGSAIREALDQPVRATEVTGTGAALGQPARLRGVYIASGSGGAIALRDGGAGGTVRLELTAGGSDVMVAIPDGGIPFTTDIHATLAAGVDAITLFYR